MTDVSVIIPVFNDADRLCLCLDALDAQTYQHGSIEAIVCDNGSSDDIQRVQKKFPHVTFVTESKQGSASARNTAVSAAKGTILAFTDSDCVPANDWIEQGLAYLNNHNDVQCIGGSVVITATNLNRITAMEQYDMLTNFRQQYYIEQYKFSVTANMLVRKATFDSVGLFDDKLFSFYGGEDCDWGIRFHKAGFTMQYVPAMTVSHPAQRSVCKFIYKTVCIVQSSELLKKKHRSSAKTHALKMRITSPQSRIKVLLGSRKQVGIIMFVQLLLIHVLECIAHIYAKLRWYIF